MGAKLTVLYVDDDPDLRTLAGLCLEADEDMAVRLAESGPQALALLDEGGRPPDVILLDVMMPGMDGPCVFAEIRSRPFVRDTPIIFVTARARPEDAASYCALGAAGLIAKPFNPTAFAPEIRRIAALARG
ncbi:MAG: Response regulator receiver domain protein [Caulobacter sp.]|jgi:two-component system OmpR family response regulator|nr:Response regulator receiver domain protein [Caulobacter sp.]